jgi:hypothetical protein
MWKEIHRRLRYRWRTPFRERPGQLLPARPMPVDYHAAASARTASAVTVIVLGPIVAGISIETKPSHFAESTKYNPIQSRADERLRWSTGLRRIGIPFNGIVFWRPRNCRRDG